MWLQRRIWKVQSAEVVHVKAEASRKGILSPSILGMPCGESLRPTPWRRDSEETSRITESRAGQDGVQMAFRWRSEGAGVAVGSITERSLSMRGRVAAQRWPLSCSLGEGKWVPTGCGGFAAAGTRFAAGKGGLIVRTMRSIW